MLKGNLAWTIIKLEISNTYMNQNNNKPKHRPLAYLDKIVNLDNTIPDSYLMTLRFGRDVPIQVNYVSSLCQRKMIKQFPIMMLTRKGLRWMPWRRETMKGSEVIIWALDNLNKTL